MSTKIDYDLRYNPRLITQGIEEITGRWQRTSDEARGGRDVYLDVPYGPDPAEKLDIFRARGNSRGLLMFIHGGYWRGFDKKDFSFVAPALANAGVTVAVVNYSLCPKVQIRDIVMQMVQACAWLYRNGSNFGAPAGRLHVAGHSAGGHLAAMMLATLWPTYAKDLPKKTVRGAMAISGLYDLGEIAKAPFLKADLRLTEKAAIEISPALMPPATDAPLYTAVGEKENDGFHFQNRLLGKVWKKVLRDDIACPGDNHFTVLDRITQPQSPLFQGVLRMLQD